MTDQYGSEPTAHEAEAGHEAAPEGETWRGDQPPVDDFADPEHTGAEGAATVSEEAEAGENVAEDDQPKKKSSFGSMLVVLIGIILAGGMVYYQFFGGAALLKPQAAAVPHKPPAPVATVQAPAPVPTPAPVAQPTPSVAANDISNLKPPSEAPSAQPTPTMPSASTGVAVPSPSIPTPAMPSAMAPSPLDRSPSTQASMPSMPQGNGSAAQIDILTARVDALQKSLDQATQQVSQLNGMVTAMQAAPAIPPATASMDDRLNKIEQDVMKLQQSPAVSTAMAKPLPVPADAIKPVKSKTKTTTVKTAKATPKPALKPTPAVSPAVTNVSWVLRAATPGEAWVSQGAGSAALQHVQVGDDLSGVGHVTAIRQNGGRWIVEGTKGSIQ